MSLETNISDALIELATAIKASKTLLNNNAADNSALNTTDKSNLVAALNEVFGLASSAANINDAGVNTTEAWSSSKIDAEITASSAAVITQLTDAAPAALDTLNELAAAMGDDPNFAATITADLASRLRFDAAQTLTAGEQAQAQTNMGVVAASDIGDFDRDFRTLDVLPNL